MNWMNDMLIKIHKLKKEAVFPRYSTSDSAGADLYACLESKVSIAQGKTCFIGTGLSLEIPSGYAGFIYARSGLASKSGLAPANKVGVIDSDYRGEIIVALYNHSEVERTISDGDRIAQIVFTRVEHAEFIESESIENTERGAGGFGSTGK